MDFARIGVRGRVGGTKLPPWSRLYSMTYAAVDLEEGLWGLQPSP